MSTGCHHRPTQLQLAYRHVRLRRADGVNAHAIVLEDPENIGEETNLVPHADLFHGHHDHARPTEDSLDAAAKRRQ